MGSLMDRIVDSRRWLRIYKSASRQSGPTRKDQENPAQKQIAVCAHRILTIMEGTIDHIWLFKRRVCRESDSFFFALRTQSDTNSHVVSTCQKFVKQQLFARDATESSAPEDCGQRTTAAQQIYLTVDIERSWCKTPTYNRRPT